MPMSWVVPKRKLSTVYVVFLIGGIGSGKSTAAQRLVTLGAARIDLDELSREVLAPHAPLLTEIANTFGADLIDDQGVLNRGLLASRVFSSPELTAKLEDLELPAIRELLVSKLNELANMGKTPPCCVVEVPLPDRMGPLLSLADEVMAVTCPIQVRRIRALGRGMTEADFDARSQRQLTDDGYAQLADTAISNEGSAEDLFAQIDAWWATRIG